MEVEIHHKILTINIINHFKNNSCKSSDLRLLPGLDFLYCFDADFFQVQSIIKLGHRNSTDIRGQHFLLPSG